MTGSIDLKTIWRDLRRQIGMLLLVAASVAMLMAILYMRRWSPVYTVRATYAVTTRGGENSMLRNLGNAQSVAGQFSQIINSSILQSRIRENLGEGIAPGNVWANVVEQTNLMTLTSSSGSLKSAFHTLKAVMDNYQDVTGFVIGDTVLTLLNQPTLSSTPQNEYHPYQYAGKVFLACLFVLVFLAALRSYFRDTIRSEEDMETHLSVRNLGAFTHEEKYKRRRWALLRTEKSMLITNPSVSFRFVESAMKVARKVQNQMDKTHAKSLLVTSCLENEGKSTVAANIALALARGGNRVVLVDMDFRKPAQKLIFGLSSDEKQLIRKVGEEEFYIIPELNHMISSVEAFSDGRIAKFLDYLKQSFSYVILDTPPMESVADAEAIADVVDASLCVVREHTALVRDINGMIETLSCYRARPIGCVLNDSYGGWKENLGGYEYSRRYGYGRGYGTDN